MLLLTDGRFIGVGGFVKHFAADDEGSRFWWVNGGSPFDENERMGPEDFVKATHWMPLPEPPK